MSSQYTAAQLKRNFIVMALAFSVNHATVTAMIALASSSLGKEIGNLQTALLYLFYTLTALFASKSIVSALGSKNGIVAGLGLYVFYVASFIVADTVPDLRSPAAVIGGCLGGIAAGFLWTAQFSYFGANAALYAEAARDSLAEDRPSDCITEEQIKEYCLKKCSGNFAAYFAIPYLGLEVVFKLLQSYIGNDSGPISAHWSAGKHFIYVINTVCAVIATLACVFIMDLKPVKETPKQGICDQIKSAGALFFSDPKMPLMMGMNVCFAFSGAYLNAYITGQVATYYLGGGYGGYLAAITAGIAGLLSLPNALGLVKPEWKKYYMILGPCSFAMVGLLPLVVGFHTLGNWNGIILIFVFQGLGRGVWESTNKAIFMEYFSDDLDGAGANLIVQNGGASALGFFVNAYASASPTAKGACTTDGDCPAFAAEAWVVVLFSAEAIIGFLVASKLYKKKIKTWSDCARDGGGSDSDEALLAP